MEKLRKIIHQTDAQLLEEFEKGLKGNNSVKFHQLLTSYKESAADELIREQLNCNENSYYVLKSRLYDRIQKFLLDNSKHSGSASEQININPTHFVYDYPLESAVAMLQQLESKYMAADSPGELINIYSALKKAHFYSDKYYTYSQAFNNQVAFALALEKAEEILYKFNRTLATFHFSDVESEIDMMNLLIKEIKNTYSLYKSPRIKLIHNIISIQMILFAKIEQATEPPVEDILRSCEEILKQYGNDQRMIHYKPVITFLNFEYYHSLNQPKKYLLYFEELDAQSQKWLLHNNNCLAYMFLLSKAKVLAQLKKTDRIGLDVDKMYFDRNDIFTDVILKYYSGLSFYYKGNLKNAITVMNGILNDVSFKNYFFIETEIKLALAFFYIKKDDYEMAEGVLKGLSRKLMGLKTQSYKNVKQAIKLLTILMNGIGAKAAKEKFREAFEQFSYYNLKEKNVLGVLQQELENLAN